MPRNAVVIYCYHSMFSSVRQWASHYRSHNRSVAVDADCVARGMSRLPASFARGSYVSD